MSSTVQYLCQDARRRAALQSSGAALTGIDYLEVRQGKTINDSTELTLVLAKPLPAATGVLRAENIAITGGVRFAPPVIASAIQVAPATGPVERLILTVPGGQPTDFSTFRLSLVTGPSNPEPPDFVDSRLSAVDFSFKVDCPSAFDCARMAPGAEAAPDPGAEIDYTARDWPTLRAQMVDRLRQLVPGYDDPGPADLLGTLVDVLAYRLDQQSYRLDWIGTEAFLDTAREPRALTRHSRLVDYAPDQGASARVLAAFTFEGGGNQGDHHLLAMGTPVLVARPKLDPVLSPAAYVKTLQGGTALVFETLHAARLWSWRNTIAFHDWSDALCTLPRGATEASFVDSSGGHGQLVPGDILVLQQTASPETGNPADADMTLRHAVRLIEVRHEADQVEGVQVTTVRWAAADALPFDLPLSTQTDARAIPCAVALANVVLADHGASLPPRHDLFGLGPTDPLNSDAEALRPDMVPPVPQPGRVWSPVIAARAVSRTAPVAWQSEGQALRPAAALLAPEPNTLTPALSLQDDFSVWQSRSDLLASGTYDRAFVVEERMDGRFALRFGDGTNGQTPAAGSVMVPGLRTGVGGAGNIGPGALAHVAVPATDSQVQLTVTNPLPGMGGRDRESAASIRRNAPEAFRVQDRAITAADYAQAARRHPEVAGALAIPRWTGSWTTIFVYIDRAAGGPVDAAFQTEVMAHLDHFRMIGMDVAVRPPVFAALWLAFDVCVGAGVLRSSAAAEIRARLRPDGPPSGQRGFFHPDRVSFGTRIYLSDVLTEIMAVPGVTSVEPRAFRRATATGMDSLCNAVLDPAEAEIFRLSDDPSLPEQGRLVLNMRGGR